MDNEIDNQRSDLPKSSGSFSIASLLLVTLLVAIAVRWRAHSYVMLPIIPALALLVMQGRSFVVGRYTMILGAIFLPATQGFFSTGSHCRKMWPELFSIAPGLVPTLFANRVLGFGRFDNSTELFETSVLLTLFIFIAYWVAGINRTALLTVLILTTIGSGFFSLILIGLLHI